MQSDQSLSRDTPDPHTADDELRVEELASAGSRRHEVAPRLWFAYQSSGGRTGHRCFSRLAGTIVTGLLALSLVLLVAADDTPPYALAYTGGRAAVVTGAGGWEEVPLPAMAGSHIGGFAPSPDDPATAYACTMGPRSGEMRLWRTRDTGVHWKQLGLPAATGQWCQIDVATNAPLRVTLFIGDVSNYPPCESNPLFLSDDGGNSWRGVAPPHVAPADAFADVCQFWPTTHHLYFLSSFERGSRDEPVGRGPQVSILARSDDDGRTWSRVDPDPSGGLVFFTFQIGNEDTMIASTEHWGDMSRTPAVWVSHTAGTTWTKVGAANPPLTTNLVTFPVPASSPRPVYAMFDEQLPSFLFRLKVSELDPGAFSWRTLPPLPVPDASPTRTGLLQVYEETGDGRLLAFGVDPHSGVPTEDALRASGWSAFQTQWLWVWDPRVGRWLAWPTPLAVSYRWGCGVCLEHSATWATGQVPDGRSVSGTYLWVRDITGDMTSYSFGPRNVAYRLFVPDAPPGELLPS